MINMSADARVKTNNNFDLIRLFTALQVAILHMDRHLNLNLSFANFLAYFPGVPIFFFISGYLIGGFKYEIRT